MRLVLALFLLMGGALAVSWEVIWQVRSSLAFGSSALGAAITLGSLAIGLGFGAICGSKLLGRLPALKRNPLAAYAIIEIIVAVSGYFLPELFRYSQDLDTWLFLNSPKLLSLIQALVIFVILLPAAAAMGASVPVMGFIAEFYNIRIGLQYGINAAGAAIGALFTTFIGLPNSSLESFGSVLAFLGIANAFLLVLFGRFLSPEAGPSVEVEKESSGTTGLEFLTVAVTGFATFGLEVVWFRLLKSALWSTSHTFAMILCAVLISTAVGAMLSSYIKRYERLLFLGGCSVFVMQYFLERVDGYIFARIGDISMLERFLLCLMLLFPSFLLISIPLPSCLARVRSIDKAEKKWAALYLSNTLGCFLGAIITGWYLLPTLGLSNSGRLLGCLVCLLAISLFKLRQRVYLTISTLLLIAASFRFDLALGKERVVGLQYYATHKRILRHFDGPDVTTSVVEFSDGTYSLFIDGFMMALDHQMSMFMKWMAYVPALLHSEPPKRALVICFGTGQTLNAVRKTDARTIDMVDINPKAFEFANEFSVNENVINDPRINKIVMDGSAWIRRTKSVYDLITLEPPAPNFLGVNSLYSLDFYRNARARLSQKGVMTQWLPAQMVTESHSQSIVKTFKEIFPNTAIYIDPKTGFGFLVGTNDDSVEISEKSFSSSPLHSAELPWEEFRGLKYYYGKVVERYVSDARVITDDNQLLAYGDLLDPFLLNVRPVEEVLYSLETNMRSE